jgi:hypothetical protein
VANQEKAGWRIHWQKSFRVQDLPTAHESRHAEGPMECAGRAQRRRRFSVDRAFRSRNQSGVALRLPRLPPHSIGPPVVTRFMEKASGDSRAPCRFNLDLANRTQPTRCPRLL